jgi:small-conductance mechanosensitive channel
MRPRIPDPLPHTQSVVAWFVANRDQVMFGAVVAVTIVGVMLVARFIGQRMVDREHQAERIGWRTVIGRVLARTSIAFMVVAAIDIVANYAEPPLKAQRLVDIAFIIAFALQAAIWARELVLAMIARRVGDHSESTLANATAIIRVLVSVALFALAIIVILDNLGVNVTALVAGLGIGGIAIGLAAQGIFSDLFAALAILFDRPFKRGDTVRYGTTTGVVERIGLKTTRVRSLTGEQVVMANTKLLENEIHNLAEAVQRRQTLTFSLLYRTPTEALRKLPEIARAAVESQNNCRLVRCGPTMLAASGIDCECVYDDRSKEQDTLARHKSAIIIALLDALAEAGLTLAYPTQTTYTAAPDGTLVMPWAPPAPARP